MTKAAAARGARPAAPTPALEVAEHLVMFVDMVGAIQHKVSGESYRTGIPNVLCHNLEAIKAVTERLERMVLPKGIRRITVADITALKFVGDGAMILFPPDAEVHAATIAAEILRSLRTIRTERKLEIDSCVGIAIGEVFIDAQTYARDVNHFGEPIDVAARLVDVAAADQILVDQRTYDVISDDRFADHFQAYGRHARAPRPVRLFDGTERTTPVGMLANGAMAFETSVERRDRVEAKRHTLRDQTVKLWFERETALRQIRMGFDADGWLEADHQFRALGRRFGHLRDSAADHESTASPQIRRWMEETADAYDAWLAQWHQGRATLNNRHELAAQEQCHQALDAVLRTVFDKVKSLTHQYSRMIGGS